LGSLLLGGYILNFFGVSLGALRVAGGLVVAIRAWGLLMEPEAHEDRKSDAASPAERKTDDIAFFPLTMPFTTGPGSIAVAIALSSQRPAGGHTVIPFFLGASLAALAVALMIWGLYRASDRVMALLGVSGARVMSRLVAFLLLCIGVQILASGVESLASTSWPAIDPQASPLALAARSATPCPVTEASRLTLDLDALASNHAVLKAAAGGAEIAPAVKADGYGLGAALVAGRLWDEGARSFYVARLSEGLALRRALGDRAATIYLLDGVTPGSAPAIEAAGLTPVLNSLPQIEAWNSHARGRVLDAALHIDTGMNRLGLRPEEAVCWWARWTG
jgi:multiple antibiotic resistance protein